MSNGETYSAKIILGILGTPSGTIQGFVIQKNGVLRCKPLKIKRKTKQRLK
jgi:hypothetical protein